MKCISKNCQNLALHSPRCDTCMALGVLVHTTLPNIQGVNDVSSIGIKTSKPVQETMATKYPKYYKTIPKDMTELDIYAVCKLFDVNDAALSHALKKIMLPGTRTGGKSRYDDIKEARDTLSRWLELNK